MSDSASQSVVMVTEKELIARAQKGEQDAFGVLYERHFDAVYRYISYRLGNVEDTEDITTSVFLKAWQKINSYTWKGKPFLAWLYRIAHNLLIDFRRGNQKISSDIELKNSLADDSQIPEKQITTDLQLKDMWDAMNQLDPLEQEVLTLRFMVGLSHQAVADIISRSAGATRILQHRALKKLRAQLDD